MTSAWRRSLGLLTLAALALGACARVRPLSGGPPDETPPQLVSTTPADSSAGIGRTPTLRLTFDEKVSVPSLRRGLRTYPHARVGDVRLDGTTAVIQFADTLPADTTWTVVLGRSVQDLPKRDNLIPREIWLTFATGASLRSAAVFGRVALHGSPEKRGAVRYEPLRADEARGDSAAAVPPGRAPRYPAAATDDEGLFRLYGLPPGTPFRLRAFVDANGNLAPDAAEIQMQSADTLQLEQGEIRRGVQFNLVDPSKPAELEGVVLNTTALDARVAVATYALRDTSDAATPDASAASADSARADSLAASRPGPPDTPRAPGRGRRSAVAAPDSVAPAPVRADTLRPLPLPVADRVRSGWDDAYQALEPEGFLRARWRIVYATRRGDYSMKLPAGRHRILAFVDVSADSAPGLYVNADSTRLEWEPLWVGGVLEVSPGEKRRMRAIEIQPPR